MTDIVIPLGWGSVWNNNELRYSLRSFEKHLKGIGQLYIVTDLSGLPKWIKNIVHIPCADLTNVASTNTSKKILKACADPRVSRDFLLSNDDFFLLQDVHAGKFPNYHRGELSDKIANPKGSPYPESKKNTFRVLKLSGNTVLHFGVHCPMLIDKAEFPDIINSFAWNVPNGYLTRSLYGNIMKVKAEYIKDNNIKSYMDLPELREYVQGKPFFSIGDGSVNRPMMEFMEEMFPVKSRWE